MSSSKATSEIWRYIENRDSNKRRELLEWQLQAREPIRKFSEMKVGDHLIKKTTVRGQVLYYHHFLCIESNGDGRVTVIHYHNTTANAICRLFKTGSFGSGASLGQIASVQELTLPHKDLIGSEAELQAEGSEVERVVWPEELQRYSPEEVVLRARKRKKEMKYHGANNNCESFVMWCLCGLNISLQAKTWVRCLCEVTSGFVRVGYQGLQQVPKIITEVVEKILDCSCLGNKIATKGVEGLSCVGSILGVVFTIVFEGIYAAWKIYENKKEWEKGMLIETREEFIKEAIDALILFLSRSCGPIGGMFLGQFLIPIPFVGAILGLLGGTWLGHIAGKALSEYSSKRLAFAVDKCFDGGFDKLKSYHTAENFLPFDGNPQILHGDTASDNACSQTIIYSTTLQVQRGMSVIT